MSHYINLVKLHGFLEKNFTLSDLEQLCFELNVEYENLPGDNTRTNKSRKLLELLERNQQLPELITHVSKARPHFNADDYYSESSVPLTPAQPTSWRQIFKSKRFVAFLGITGVLITILVVINLVYPYFAPPLPNKIFLSVAELDGCSPSIQEEVISRTSNIIDYAEAVEFETVKNVSQPGLILVNGQCSAGKMTLTVQSNQLSPVFIQLFNLDEITFSDSENVVLSDGTQLIRGIIYFTQADYQNAVNTISELVENDALASDDVKLFYANSLLLDRQYESAAQIYNSILDTSNMPSYRAGILNNLGILHFNSAIVHELAGESDAKYDDYQRALAMFQNAVQETLDEDQQKQIYANQGFLNSAFGAKSAAEEDCRKALDIDFQDSWANLCAAVVELTPLVVSQTCNVDVLNESKIYFATFDNLEPKPAEFLYWQRVAMNLEESGCENSRIINQECHQIETAFIELKRRNFSPLHIHQFMDMLFSPC